MVGFEIEGREAAADDADLHRIFSFDLIEHIEACDDPTEDTVEVVESGDGIEGDEELRAVGVGAAVGH